jgi:hypothetical protein
MADRPTFALNPSTAHCELNGWNSHIQLQDLNKGEPLGLLNVLEITSDTLCVYFHSRLHNERPSRVNQYILHAYILLFFFFIIWFVRLLALRPLLSYCASLGW